MQIDYALRLETTQKLIMTPQLRQAIAILQLSAVELEAMVENEFLENPVLELEEKRAAEEQENVVQAEVEAAGNPEDGRNGDAADANYDEWAEYFENGMGHGQNLSTAESNNSLELLAANTLSLHEHLEMQLHFAILNTASWEIGRFLIGCIDDNGYFCCTVRDVAENLHVSPSIVEDVLKVIQTFDPVGVGASNLKECLLLQVDQKGIIQDGALYRLVTLIIDNYLEHVANGRVKFIADSLGATVQEVQHAIDIIRRLDPKPGRAFGGIQPAYILPDVTVERVNGSYMIIINDTNVPQLSINPYYRQVIRDADGEAKKFVEGRINSAVWLIKSIEQRRRTLYRVAEAIVELQRDFFDHGVKHLKPLTMKKVAERIEVHESTVSRAVANKYMATPHGLFSMHTFFSSGIQGVSGEDVAASRVKQEIRELIATEDSTQPLSDQGLSNILNKRGIHVSRRTVAKYREEINIPASSKRKRY
ncbi:MAG TPA: RNA polymerase factor sigma-54 [Methylomusa anaerophila]|uniref:RNA polymerase sigma-54 factor n=1 Tax=Methylomusa anaerophila TaxID=1930071 RepID=A0A348AL17_9FIRM|nr:RNA polymerase factor sigma-54 [Methylomusa anaerophila]BBB91765.1 RNA polymerase sigma-54 factor [Methylomusa anaerophila]HML88498.1 RNA polymerase factor sigma-54 [Methylomusa anaerophila]